MVNWRKQDKVRRGLDGGSDTKQSQGRKEGLKIEDNRAVLSREANQMKPNALDKPLIGYHIE